MHERGRQFLHSESLFSTASGVPRRQLENCRIVANRDELLRLMPKRGVAAVLGLAQSGRVRQIIEATEPAGLHVFRFQFDPGDDISRLGAAIAARRLVFHDCPGLEPDVERLDWAYIENEITTDAVNFHIERVLPLLRKDGILVFNGYPSHAGVVGAVNDLAVKEACRFLAYSVTSNDVALRLIEGE